ncbi:MAG: right-handed parallel beta-helix repeat-containing protein [Clostridia bacterium]|nr:right-handed parallel beta-helix repeat-containing protein [Clostridia bacterium]
MLSFIKSFISGFWNKLKTIAKLNSTIQASPKKGRTEEVRVSASSMVTIGSITKGDNVLTVSDIGDFRINQGINVANAGPSGASLVTVITAIKGNDITLKKRARTTTTNTIIRHDDTVALQQLIDRAAAAGGTVVIPAGTYMIGGNNNPLYYRSNVQISGEGIGKTIFMSTSTSRAEAFLKDAAAVSNVKISNITFDFSNRAHFGIKIAKSGTTNVSVENCEFKNLRSGTSAYAGVVVNFATQATITSCLFNAFTGTAHYGIAVFSAANGIKIYTNTFDSIENECIKFDSYGGKAINADISNNIIKNMGKYGIHVHGCESIIINKNVIETTTKTQGYAPAAVGVGLGSRRITITENMVRNAGEISAYDSYDVTIENNTILGSVISGIEVNDNNGTTPSPTDNVGIRVIGNTIEAAQLSGIFVSGTDVLIKNNNISRCFNDGIKVAEGAWRVQVQSNTCKNNGQNASKISAGIRIANTSDIVAVYDSLFEYNVCYDDQSAKTQDYGIYLVTTKVSNARLIGNDCRNNAIGQIYKHDNTQSYYESGNSWN